MSESMAGVTFLAFGNGSPDVFSTFAAFSTNSSSLAIGELFGAAGFITAVVAGSMALVRPFKVAKKAFIRDVLFFTVSAAFSLSFLYDGQLHLWECVTMVVFYVFYVCFVVAWHWWLGRRKRRRERDAAARGQYVNPSTGELDVEESYQDYHDEEDEDNRSRPSVSRGTSAEDFSALERGSTLDIKAEDVDEDDEEREAWLAELGNNMRLNGPGRSRRNTLVPIRPSLVGALEFQAVLKSLQRSQSRQTIAMHNRRYSDDPTFTTAQQQDQMSTTSDPASRPPYHVVPPQDGESPTLERPAPEVLPTGSGRTRAVSANDAGSLRIDPRFVNKHALRSDKLVDIAEDENGHPASSIRSVPTVGASSTPPPALEVSDADANLIANPWEEEGDRDSSNHLALPGNGYFSAARQPRSPKKRYEVSPNLSPGTQSPGTRSPGTRSPRTRSPYVPRLTIPSPKIHGSPDQSPRTQSRGIHKSSRPSPSHKSSRGSVTTSPFPSYNDGSSPIGSRPPSLYLGPPSISAESQAVIDEEPQKKNPLKWWPYKVLPPPNVLLYKLFPTFEHWEAKNWWEKALAVVAAPSMFLLTITLPVAEYETKDEGELDGLGDSLQPYTDDQTHRKSLVPDSPELHPHPRPHQSLASTEPSMGSALLATNIEQHSLDVPGEHQPLLSPGIVVDSPSTLLHNTADGPQPWNRWLTITQLFLAPFLIVLVIYTQYLDPPDGIEPLVKPILISLLVSSVLLVPLLLTTTPTHRPQIYQTIFSMAGFVVSIAWISSIAAQVVAVLKALAVIMNMSHAIMGLTIFAVGNSLGDLVADITVARLGFPIMALSACFGGPMLNILLGIGISGCWILIRGAAHRHHKHPGKEIKFRSYEIQVGETLIVSGVTLLITLIGLLFAVPLNKWVFSRKIGWALIGIWVVSTTINVVLEVTGIGPQVGEELTTFFGR